MNANTSIAIVFSILILTVGGCLTLHTHDIEMTAREKEKTIQMQTQFRIDSLKNSTSTVKTQ
jgi:hypothetical protein